jgi:hypothetical protein
LNVVFRVRERLHLFGAFGRFSLKMNWFFIDEKNQTGIIDQSNIYPKDFFGYLERMLMGLIYRTKFLLYMPIGQDYHHVD